MNLFGIFKRRKKMSLKELYPNFLDEMWMCRFTFRPWEPGGYEVVFKKVKITEARATPDGIFVKSDEKEEHCSNCICGYIDRFTCNWEWTAFFETEEEAKRAYDALMEEWISVMRSKMSNRQMEA